MTEYRRKVDKGMKRTKMCIDILMTVLLYFLMARQLTGNTAHEWLGAGMFLLWIIHHILNRRWFTHLLQGNYTPVRIFQTVINIALFAVMIGMMVSGIILSRTVFAFLPVSGGVAMARSLHIFCGFWCFVLMSLHLGLHWNMIFVKMIKPMIMTKMVNEKKENPQKLRILRILAGIIALYGLWSFIKNQFLMYMLGISSFAFFDFERPVILYVTEYLAIMGLFVWISHYGMKVLLRVSEGRQKRK